jgi:S1-C subfamily serine protease
MKKRQMIIFTMGISLLFGGMAYPAENQPDFKNSVVKIFASSSVPNFRIPWQAKENSGAVGSGAVIFGNRILTNAHVVAYATFIEVKKSNSDKRFRAEVEAIGNDCDLALLKVKDGTFFEGVPSLTIAPLPELQDTVMVVGFPQGGEELSVTKGVVSRIDTVSYSHSMEQFMAVQIDAAINSGNSGGPVIQNNQLVGIAFQGLEDADNIGYMIPGPIIRHFLEDLKDGQYDGFPYVGIDWDQSMNPSMRERYGIKDYDGGIILKYVSQEIEKKDLLRVGDVVLSIDAVPIGADATVLFKKNSRMPLDYLFALKQVGESIDFEVLRDGKKIHVKVPAIRNDVPVKYRSFYEKPPYYIYGGMIFTVLNKDLLLEGFKKLKETKPDFGMINLFYYLVGPGRFKKEEQKDIVVLLNVLPDEVNVGYHDLELEVVREANGKPINSLADLALSIENNQAEWDVIRTEDKAELVLNHKEAEEAEPRILKNYGIPSPYSADIKKKLDGNE